MCGDPHAASHTITGAFSVPVADQLALSLDATPPGTYRQRGTSTLQGRFPTHFPELCARYEADFAKRLGRCRLQRISSAVERFLDCGDHTKGIARIQRLLLVLPHRQIVFTHRSGRCTDFPKVLRVFFRYDRRLYGATPFQWTGSDSCPG